MRQVLGPGALGRPRGMGWRGRWEGGPGWGIHNWTWNNRLFPNRKRSTSRLRLSLPPCHTILQFLLGFTPDNVVGMYLAQNYDIPNLAKKLEEIKKDVDAKKKPPSC
ncbi:unnamed protein product [Rangifer tarandus platyrhynchus]|uniref:Uncharacterized protein n=1 Tax=Rangifer tarandus platyrhynchus TaxID=3082113 RepID=A0ABN9A4B0_RANTA|nr:unnamed protein product [Rangifer tarandus platyrhynchus]